MNRRIARAKHKAWSQEFLKRNYDIHECYRLARNEWLNLPTEIWRMIMEYLGECQNALWRHVHPRLEEISGVKSYYWDKCPHFLNRDPTMHGMGKLPCLRNSTIYKSKKTTYYYIKKDKPEKKKKIGKRRYPSNTCKKTVLVYVTNNGWFCSYIVIIIKKSGDSFEKRPQQRHKYRYNYDRKGKVQR